MAIYKQEVLNLLGHQGNVNYNYNEISLAKIKKPNQQINTPLILPSVGENAEPTELGMLSPRGCALVQSLHRTVKPADSTHAPQGPRAHSQV